MAEVWIWKGWNTMNLDWTTTISASGNRIGFCGATFGSSIGVNEWQDSTHNTNDTMTIDYCNLVHLNNCKYVSSTEISLNGAAAATLSTGTVPASGCSIRITFLEDTMSTQISNVRFYAYDGLTPTTPPSGVNTVAFERTTDSGTSAAIYKDTAQGSGKAWDSTSGVGGSAKKLIMSDQTTASGHMFYIGASASPTSVGLKTAFVFRIELDYQ